MPDRVISVPQATQIATRIKNKFDNVNERLQVLSDDASGHADWIGYALNRLDLRKLGTSNPTNWTIANPTRTSVTIVHNNIYSSGAPNILLELPVGTYVFHADYTNSNTVFLLYKNGSWAYNLTDGKEIEINQGDENIRLLFSNQTAGTYTITDVSLVRKTSGKIQQIKGDITTLQANQAKTNTTFYCITGNEPFTILESGKYINLSGSSVQMVDGTPASSGSSGSYGYAVVSCIGGDKFTVSGSGGNSTRLWGFVDSAGNVLSVSAQNATENNKVITAPVNSAFLIVHNRIGDFKESYKGAIVDKRLDELEIESNTPNVDVFNNSLGNVSIRCAKEQSYTDGTHPKIEWYLLEEAGTNKFYYSRTLTDKTYLFTTPFPAYKYSMGVLQNGDIIAVMDSDALGEETKDDTKRTNPYVWLASEHWAVCHEVDFGNSISPCGWLENCGFKVLANGTAVFAEYTRLTVATSNVWVISGTPTNASNWTITKSFAITSVDGDTGFKHCHMIMQDFYTGICYLATGDDNEGSMVFYSSDNCATWTQLVTPDSDGNTNAQGWITGSQMYCRMLNMTFTPTYIYWATDTSLDSLHKLFKAERDANGVLDYNTVSIVANLANGNGQAGYGTCYIPEYNAVFLAERCDVSALTMTVRLVTLSDSVVHNIGTLEVPTGQTAKHLGFRTRFTEWYPISSNIHFGFAMHVIGRTDAVNRNKGFGNLGSAERLGLETINNLIVRISKDSTFGMTLDTIYI